MRTRIVPMALIAALTLAGCGGSEETSEASAEETPTGATSSEASPSGSPEESPAASPSPQLVDEGANEKVTIQGGTVAPSAKRVDIDAGERLMLTVASDRAGELHVHSSPEQELAFGRGTTVLDLILTSPGIVEVEEHESGTVILRVYVS